MKVYSVVLSDTSLHLFSCEDYADKFSKYYSVCYKQIDTDIPVDMTVVNNLSEWELYHFSRLDGFECGDKSDHLYVLAKNSDHAVRILKNHNINTNEYCNYTVELCDIAPGTTLDCLYNFDKKE